MKIIARIFFHLEQICYLYVVKFKFFFDMKKVIAIIEKASDGGYGIYCPDLEGVALYGYGLTEQEAKENLQENLEAVLEYYEEEDKSLPESLDTGKISKICYSLK
jgi:predicted RNase H-like HicB family nuclease